MEREKISAVIIAFNEENSIEKTIRSLSFCDEVVVVDSGSQDKTVELAQKCGARVITHPWSGFGPQKKIAVKEAQHHWVLSLDADEVASAELRTEILSILNAPQNSAYALPIHTYFMGKDMHLWGEKNGHVRLFDRRQANFGDESVHEKVHLRSGTLGKLKGKVLHYSYQSLEDYFRKFNLYTSQAAQNSKRRPLSPALSYAKSILRFYYLYLFRGGFRLGKEGFYWCLFSAFYTLVRNAKQLERLGHKVPS